MFPRLRLFSRIEEATFTLQPDEEPSQGSILEGQQVIQAAFDACQVIKASFKNGGESDVLGDVIGKILCSGYYPEYAENEPFYGEFVSIRALLFETSFEKEKAGVMEQLTAIANSLYGW